MEENGGDAKLDLLTPKPRVYSPMLQALVKGDAKHVKLMLKVGADPNQRDGIGRTPLIMVSYYANERKAISLAGYIIKQGGKIDYTDRNGMNALHHACQKGKEKLAELLLKHRDDYDIFAKDNQGNICSDYLTTKGNEALMNKFKSLILEYGLDPGKYLIFASEQQSPKNTTVDYNPAGNIIKRENKKRLTCDKNDQLENDVKSNRYHFKATRSAARREGKREQSKEKVGMCTDKATQEHNGSLFIKTIPIRSCKRNGGSMYRSWGRKSIENVNEERARTRQSAHCKSTEFDRKSKSRLSSNKYLIDILKIYEKQHSDLYREGAKVKHIEDHCDKIFVTPTSSRPNDYFDDEFQRVPSGRTSRSMSLVPSNIQCFSAMRKRRPSRVSLLSNKPIQINLNDTPMKPNMLRQRRFSSVATSIFTSVVVSPEHLMRKITPTSSRALLIKRPDPELSSIIENKTRVSDKKEGHFTSSGETFMTNRNVQKKVSSLPSLQVFVEKGEHLEATESH